MSVLSSIPSLLSGHPLRAMRQIKYSRLLARPRRPLKLHLGCGQRRLEGFINIDGNYSPAVDYVADITRIRCPADTVGRIESYHVIEHLPHAILSSLISDWHHMLVPGGVVVAECPDFDQDIREYLEGNEQRLYSIFGLQRFPGDTHLFGYNAERLQRIFRQGGFSECAVSNGTDYHAENEPCLRIECTKT